MSGAATSTGVVVLFLAMAACGGEVQQQGEVPIASEVDTVSAGYQVADVMDSGDIRGTIRYGGEAREASVISVADDSAECGVTQRVQPVIIGPGGGLADVVVSLVDVRRGSPFEVDDAPVLDQSACRFHPQVVLVPVGTPVRVLNSDPLTHNVHTAAFDNRAVNRSQAPGSDAIELSFNVAEKVRVKCDLHPWMGAWIVVMDHPYHAVTDSTGTFTLPAVPPGDYMLETWHEELGTSHRPVTVIGGGVTDLEIELTPGE